MKGYLLDTNLLIALFWPSHGSHGLAVNWFSRHRGKGWATCPITEAGFVRIVSNPAFSRDAVRPRDAIQILCENTVAQDHQFWPAESPLDAAVAFAGVHLIGHQQVTDAYLLGLAISRDAELATLDKRIGALTEAKSKERSALEIVE